MQPTKNDEERQRQTDQRAQQKTDPRYVDVRGAGGIEQRRYIIADERPELVGAYQTCRIPDHIQITQVNAEGFTATDEAAAELWTHLEHWRDEMKRLQSEGAKGQTDNPVLARERHQVELGNVPQSEAGAPAPAEG